MRLLAALGTLPRQRTAAERPSRALPQPADLQDRQHGDADRPAEGDGERDLLGVPSAPTPCIRLRAAITHVAADPTSGGSSGCTSPARHQLPASRYSARGTKTKIHSTATK